MRKEEESCGHHAMQPRQLFLRAIPTREMEVRNRLNFHPQCMCLVNNNPLYIPGPHKTSYYTTFIK